ncbi:MAG: sulfite exporter TauE/SafE family protein [Desulfatiglandales bacterium]
MLISPFLMLPSIFLISLVLTMVGLGGGLFFSPLFVLLHMPAPVAVSASLFLNGSAAASAAYVYYRKKMIDFSVSLPLLLTSSVAAPAGAFLTARVDLRFFLGIMGCVILLAGVRMFFSPAAEDDLVRVPRRRKILRGGLLGLVIGFMAGLLGIGGGVFVVPLLIYSLRVPTRTAAASSIFIVCFSSFTGFVTHASLGNTDWPFVLLAGLFSFAGGQAGSRIMSERLKAKPIRVIFGVILLLLSVRIFLRAFS